MNRFKKCLSVSNLILLAFIAFVIFNRGPILLKNWHLKGKAVSPIQTVTDINGQTISLANGPYALVFWATWCKPCDLELHRVQNLIEDEKVRAERVIAVALDKELSPVISESKEREYDFHVIWENANQLADYYEVSGTPTVVIVGKDNKIKGASTGVSPLLEMRLKKYLN